MSLARSARRKKQVAAQKGAQKKMQGALNELAGLPKKCSTCSVKFDPKDDHCLDNWMIRQTPEGVSMFCDVCYAA